MTLRSCMLPCAFISSICCLASGCDDGGEPEGATGNGDVAAGESGAAQLSHEEAAERAPSRVDPAYVDKVNTQIADLEITAEAMKAAAAQHPDDELLSKMIERADKKIPTAKKKVEHLQEVARDENIAELQAEIDDLIATIADAVDKGAKRAQKLDQMPERAPREPRQRRNAEEGEGDVIDDETGTGDGGGADDGSGA